MSYRHGEWKYFHKEEEAREHPRKPFFYRVQKVTWNGPGWYWIHTYDQPCPRGCCRDNVMSITPAVERVTEIREEMRELAEALREARGKQ